MLRKIAMILLLLALSLLHPEVRWRIAYAINEATITVASVLRIEPPAWTWRMPRVPSK